MILIFYSWTALNGASGSSVAMGITDDRGRAMRAGEECLGSGRLTKATRRDCAARSHW